MMSRSEFMGTKRSLKLLWPFYDEKIRGHGNKKVSETILFVILYCLLPKNLVTSQYNA